jgi:hypothetical protein
MRRAAHELVFLLAILAVVVTLPIVVIRAATMALGTWPGDGAPEWWERASLGAAVLFGLASLFLIWDTYRISRIETTGVIVSRLRTPPRRRRRLR